MKQLPLLKKRKAKPGRKLGRPVSTNCGARAGREEFSANHPVHVTLRLREDLPNLRTQKGAKLIKHAILGAQSRGVRVIHFAILSNHVHLLIEANGQMALSRAMMSFCTRIALEVRKWAKESALEKLGRLGLFRGRYDVQVLKTPTQLRNALKYVLFNPCKHFETENYLDVFTSACIFENWKKLAGQEFKLTSALRELKAKISTFISLPETWLMREGWLRTPV